MAETSFIPLVNSVWSDVSGDVTDGYLTNHSDNTVFLVTSTGQPLATLTMGHRLRPGAAISFKVVPPEKVWGVAQFPTAILALTEGVFTAGGTSGTAGAPYFYSAALGRIPNVSTGIMVGQNNNTGSTGFDAVTDQGGKYTYLTANTQLYVQSTDPLDVDVDVLMQGLDDDYNPIVLTANTNGVVQEPLSAATSFRVHTFFVSGDVTPVGELYLAELGSATGGVPDDATKIKAKIPLSTDTTGGIVDTGTIYASDNFSHMGVVSVPAGKTMAVVRIILGTGKDDNIKIGGRVRPPGGAFKWFNRNPVPVYQSNVVLEFDPPILTPEKYDLEFMSIGGSPGSLSQVQVFFILEDM